MAPHPSSGVGFYGHSPGLYSLLATSSVESATQGVAGESVETLGPRYCLLIGSRVSAATV